jgi:lipoprotein LpqH
MRRNGLALHGTHGIYGLHNGAPSPPSNADTTSGLRRPRTGGKSLPSLWAPPVGVEAGDDPVMFTNDDDKSRTVVKHSLVVAVVGAAIVVAGLAGCSNGTKSSVSSTVSSLSSKASLVFSPETASASATPGPSLARVVIDGQDQNVQGNVTCATVGGNVTITIGQGTTGVVAVVSDSDPPVVHSVALGNVNGMTLGYQEGVSDAEAQASRNGNSYKITGTAAGVDKSYPKAFEIDVTCP